VDDFELASFADKQTSTFLQINTQQRQPPTTTTTNNHRVNVNQSLHLLIANTIPPT
jgi:hypothetical protein